jgi:MFS family permease
MATLFGIVFFSHQVGSFIGVLLGGIIYARTGSYDILWWIGVLLGVFAALVHLPIKDAPAPRLEALARPARGTPAQRAAALTGPPVDEAARRLALA